MHSAKFWDNIFSDNHENEHGKLDKPNLDDPILQKALAYFGKIKGKKIVDLGCGRGAASFFFAHYGANVISIDLSEIALSIISEYCIKFSISRITPFKLPAQEIAKIGEVDFVFGSMILHHIEPFDEFVVNLKNVISPEGKAFFYENSANSRLMMWFRKNIVGKLWVPKHGDSEEFPLKDEEIEELRKHFNVIIEYPELLYFRMVSYYLLRGHFEKYFEFLDKQFFKIHYFKKYSYRQCLYLS